MRKKEVLSRFPDYKEPVVKKQKEYHYRTTGNWGDPWPPIEEIDTEGAIRLMSAVLGQAADDYRYARDKERCLIEIWKEPKGVYSTNRVLSRTWKAFFSSEDFEFWAQGTTLIGPDIYQQLKKDEDEKDDELKEVWKTVKKTGRIGPFEDIPWWDQIMRREFERMGSREHPVYVLKDKKKGRKTV